MWLGRGFIKCAANIGVKSLATSSEIKIDITAVQPNCLNMRPGIPPMKAVGKNTAIKVNEVAITALPISAAALIDA